MDNNDRNNHSAQSGQFDHGPGFRTNSSTESSISFSTANNLLHETQTGSSGGPIVTSDMTFTAAENAPYTGLFPLPSHGDAGAAVGTSNSTRYPRCFANRCSPPCPYCPLPEDHQFLGNPDDAQYLVASLQGGTFTLPDPAVSQEHLLDVNLQLASQSPHPQDSCSTGNYESQSISTYSGSVPIGQLWLMSENQMQNVDGAEHLGNYSLLINAGVSLSMGTSAGMQYGSASPAPPGPAGVVQRFNGDYYDVFQRPKEVISSNGHDDIFMLPSIEPFEDCGPTTRLPTQNPDQQSLRTTDSTSTIHQGLPVAQEANPEVETHPRPATAPARHVTSALYPTGIHFTKLYNYHEAPGDRRKNNSNHELRRAINGA